MEGKETFALPVTAEIAVEGGLLRQTWRSSHGMG